MERDEIESALRELANTLNERRISAKVYLVGGAVMVLAFGARMTTEDVDGSAYPEEDVLEVVGEIAARRGLPNDWLNTHSKGFLPNAKDPDWCPLVNVGGIEIVTADERTMLAMKLRASRGARDARDIEFLLDRCGIDSEQGAVDLYEEYFPDDPMPARAPRMLQGALDAVRKKRSLPPSCSTAKSVQGRHQDGRFASKQNPEGDVDLA